MKIGCLIFSDNIKYDKLHQCAIKSFCKFHEDVLVFSIQKTSNIISLLSNKLNGTPAGIQKFLIADFLFSEHKLDKIIILGADTITCDRLDEFINDNENDILTSLDYPYQLITANRTILSSNIKENHVNADVVCFNNKESLKSVIKTCFEIRTEYFEQAALNYICNISKQYKTKIVDGNYNDSGIVYNVRAKGNLCAKTDTKPWAKYTNKFHVKDNKLFTGTHENVNKEKQIKVWHYCEGLGNLSNSKFTEIINYWINEGFNAETKNFFSEQCDCEDFFKKPFSI